MTHTKDQLVKIAKQHESRKKMNSISKETAKFKNELNAPEILPTENEANTILAKRVKQCAKQKYQQR